MNQKRMKLTKHRNSLTAGTVCLSLAAGLLAGCSGGSPGDSSASSAPSAPAAASPSAAATASAASLKASDKPITAAIHMHYFGTRVFDNEWEVFKKAAELTNVTLKGTASKSATNSDEVYNLMVAGGEIPDVVHFYISKLNQLGRDGGLLDLQSLIDKHAPNIKAYFEKNPDVKKAAQNISGTLYAIPNVPDGQAQMGWFVRKDWLDKLSLQQPKTVAELYQVLKAFKEKDPNGNGKADEVPYFNREKRYGVYDLLALWDSYRWFYMKDGKELFGPSEPQFKNAMVNLAKWYKEGLIDKEIFTRGNNARDILLGDNLGGLTHDWFASTAGYNSKLKDKVAGLSFLPIAPPASEKGVIKEWTSRTPYPESNLGWGISAKSKYSVELIKYFDFWFTEQGRTLMNYGIEGKTYNMVDGKPKLTDDLIKKDVVGELNKFGALQSVGYAQNYEQEKQWTDPIALAGIEDYTKNNYILKPTLPLKLEDADAERLSKLTGPLMTYVEETMQKWVMGAESVEGGYDKFQTRLKELGLDEILKIRQAARDKMK